MKTLAFLTLFLGFAFAANAQEKKEEKLATSPQAMSAKELYHLKLEIQQNPALTPAEVQSVISMLEKSPSDPQVLQQVKETLVAAAKKAGRVEKPTHE